MENDVKIWMPSKRWFKFALSSAAASTLFELMADFNSIPSVCPVLPLIFLFSLVLFLIAWCISAMLSLWIKSYSARIILTGTIYMAVMATATFMMLHFVVEIMGPSHQASEPDFSAASFTWNDIPVLFTLLLYFIAYAATPVFFAIRAANNNGGSRT